jgi:preprotein translocase subunit SecD
MMRETLTSLRKYWRIYLLVIVSIASIIILFSPVVPGLDVGAASEDAQGDREPSFVEEFTGLQFSIELGGGTRIRAPIEGVTAEGVDIGERDLGELEQQISDELEGVQSTDVAIRIQDGDTNTLEITSNEVAKEELRSILDSREIEYNSIRNGVTDETRQQAVNVLQSRIDAAGLSGGNVRQVSLQDGSNLILLEVPNLDRQETINLVTRKGEVRIDIYYLDQDTQNYTNQTAVLTQEDFRTIGSPRQGSDVQPPNVPVTLEPQAAERFEDATIETGVAQPGGTVCQYENAPTETQPCLLTVVDGDVVYSAGMNSNLAANIRSGDWKNSGDFILQTESFEEAQDLSVNLQSGGLPAPLDVEEGEVSFVAPEQGEDFRIIALMVGILSTLAVATSVSLRYGKAKVAIPMVFTALAEVLILLAIAVLLSYPIDIAVIAGLVAVIGTGVDDLIIIADRIIGGDSIASSTRIFEQRFRKALWVIMSAAGTTILALGPLAVLELRALQGFAIFTIIGVIAGVLITRPAYGDILRYLYTNK